MPVHQLLAEIKQRGYTGSHNLLYRYITQGRVESDRPAISPKRLTRYLLTRPDKLQDHQRERLEAAVSACHQMTALAALVVTSRRCSLRPPATMTVSATGSTSPERRTYPICALTPADSNSTARPSTLPSPSHSTMDEWKE